MIFTDELYEKTNNKENLEVWEKHLHDLKSLNLNEHAEKLKVPVLVPIGNRILFRGQLKHTSEFTVSLGAGYFVKCSLTQAEVLRQHKIDGAQFNVDLYRKEKEYLLNQLSFMKNNVYEEDGQDILEVYSEEEDKAWRKKHRENVRKYKQGNTNKQTKSDDKELWERLEELELQEELENELLDNHNETVDKRTENMLQLNQRAIPLNIKEKIKKNKAGAFRSRQRNIGDDTIEGRNGKLYEKKDSAITVKASKHDLLQQVLNKQNKLENKLDDLKCREREQPKTEQDLINKLDELEELEELEDEIERLDDALETEDEEIANSEQDINNSDEELSTSAPTKLKKSISFADENNSETLQLYFLHSDVEPNKIPYNPEGNISKPSDLYEAYSHLFDNKKTSILKKSKYAPEMENVVKLNVKQHKKVEFKENVCLDNSEPEKVAVDRTIVIKDVVENVGVNQHKIKGGARPTSLFRQRRMQTK